MSEPVTFQKLYDLMVHMNEKIDSVRNELKSDMISLRQELKHDMFSLREEQKQDMLLLSAKLDDFQKDVSAQFDLLVNDRLDFMERRQDLSSVRLDRVEAKVSQLAEKQ